MNAIENRTVTIEFDGDKLFDVWRYLGQEYPSESRVLGCIVIEY